MREINRDNLPKAAQKPFDTFDKYEACMRLVNKPPPVRVLLNQKDYQRVAEALKVNQKLSITEASYHDLPIEQDGGE